MDSNDVALLQQMDSDDETVPRQEDEQDEWNEFMAEWETEFWETWREEVADDLAQFLAEKEIELYRAVLWRRQSFGTQSANGSQFAERILTTVTNLRLQHRNVLDYLTAACEAKMRGGATPSLLPDQAALAAVIMESAA